MQFSEKLDFLMNVTNTSNSALALNIKLDPSHISRLRRGERGALKNEACIAAMAAYFSRHCERDYQQRALAETLRLGAFPAEEGALAALLAKWLISDGKNESDSIASFLSGFANLRGRQAPTLGSEQLEILPESGKSDTEVFYGINGKRRAVIRFLTEVISREKPQTLLLFSDEATDWMADDHAFAAQWGALMSQFLSKGGQIKIIHTVSRDLDEMLSAIGQWLPLYMTGSIEPYYYPKKRDGVFKRTLFIAPNVAAIVTTSVGNMRDQAANVFLKGKKAVASYEREFLEYLGICRPLMRVFRQKDEKAYFEALCDLEREPGDAIMRTESLSVLTMPEKALLSIASRVGGLSPDFFACHRERAALLERNIRLNGFTEIISLPEPEKVAAGELKVSLAGMLAGGPAYYTAEEYAVHLENILELLEKYDKFNVRLASGTEKDSYMVLVKEDVGAIVAKTTTPPVALAIAENNMGAALWDYLINITGSTEALSRSREDSRKKLSDYVSALRAASEGK